MCPTVCKLLQKSRIASNKKDRFDLNVASDEKRAIASSHSA